MEELLSSSVLEGNVQRNLSSSTATPLVLSTKRKAEAQQENTKKDKAPKTKKQRKQDRENEKKQKVSRAQKKRLDRLQAKKEKKDKRQQLFDSLSKNVLDPDQMKLLHSTTTLGQKETLKNTSVVPSLRNKRWAIP